MSSVEYLREFVSERLASAAEEIFGVFQKTIVEYEEEIDRQRRLLDIVWKPQIKLHRIELHQQHVCIKEEEVLADQQLCIQERNSSLDQEDPEPPQIKEEQEELCTSQEGEQLVLKQETDTFMLTPTYEQSDHSEDQTLCLNPDKPPEEESVVNIQVKSSVVSEQKSEHQLLSYDSQVAESQDQKGGECGDSGSTRNAQPKPNNHHHKSRSYTKNVNNPTVSKIHCNTQPGKTVSKCDTCRKAFKCMSALKMHMKIHKGEKTHSYKTCGKDFTCRSNSRVHTRTHTGEKPYTCKTCGKEFRQSGNLTVHLRRVHTDECAEPLQEL